MRKFFVLIAVAVLAVGLFSPAEAAKKKSVSISLNPAPGGTQSTYNDTSLDLSSSSAPKNTFTTIRAKVKGKGGRLAGKKVTVYATNMNSAARQRVSLGSAKIAKSGYITKRFNPGSGEGGTYKIEIVKKAGGGYKAKTKTFYIRTFEFVSLATFYDAAASTPGFVTSSPMERVGSGSKDYWSDSYALQGPGSAVYDVQGYKCFFFNLKIGVSATRGAEGGSYSLSQPSRGVIMGGSKTPGSGFDEPTKDQGKNISPTEPITISVAGSQATRFVLGNPKISCTFPTRETPTPF